MQDSSKYPTVSQIVGSLMAPLRMATTRGEWDGFDGAVQYVKGARINWLKSQNTESYEEALKQCLNAIVEATESQMGQTTVLKCFVKEYEDFVLKLSKEEPSIFLCKEQLKKVCETTISSKEKLQEFKDNLLNGKNIKAAGL